MCVKGETSMIMYNTTTEINFDDVLTALKDNQDKLTDYQKLRFLMALDRYKRSRDEIFDVFCMMVKTWSEEEQEKYECVGCERGICKNRKYK